MFPYSGYQWYLHRQEVPIHGGSLHSWTHSHRSCHQNEDEQNYCYQKRLPSFRQEVPSLREETQEHVCSLLARIQVINCLFKRHSNYLSKLHNEMANKTFAETSRSATSLLLVNAGPSLRLFTSTS